MSSSLRPTRVTCAIAFVALFAAILMAGCGGSGPTTRVTNSQSVPANPSSGAAVRMAPPSHHPVAPAHPVPAAFRPAQGALSDAEVRRELDQMAAVQHQQHQQALSAAAANLAGLLPWSQEFKSGVQVSVASVFTDYGLGLACGGLLGREQLGVAHKTAPCGTLITFTYAGRSLTVPVIDRGPYVVGREWDLTGATAEALGFPGLGQIQWSLAS
jgi:rare lipoprotein A (peptidoglycan hydrolase)